MHAGSSITTGPDVTSAAIAAIIPSRWSPYESSVPPVRVLDHGLSFHLQSPRYWHQVF